MSGAPIHIVVNGESHEIPEGTTVSDLVVRLGLGGKPVAVERNREVVPRARHPETTLVDGDRVELVTFVGGG
jgi:sulfur carrier protein